VVNERGQYGTAGTSSVGVGIVVGVIVFGSVMLYDVHRASKRGKKFPGLKPGSARSEQDAYWDSHYAKRGLILTKAGDLEPMVKR
jgi:hypothetical protein